MKFSQRIGKTSVKAVLQLDEMDDDLRVGIWNVLTMQIIDPAENSILQDSQFYILFGGSKFGVFDSFLTSLWVNHLKWRLDDIGDIHNVRDMLKRVFFERWKWYEIYDLLEFIASYAEQNDEPIDYDRFISACNTVLERECSGYRLVGTQVVQITDENELKSIELALQSSSDLSLSGVEMHLKEALAKLSDRKNPDYRNSIKESISAVEALACLITKKPNATLGDALRAMPKQVEVHPALREGFLRLYGYTSDADGIRHKIMEEPTTDFEDAKYMLISCSAFINYLIGKSAKAGIKL